MTSHIETTDRANLIGSLWMITAMALFAIEDMFLKSVARDMPIGQMLMLFGLGGVVFFASVAWGTGQGLWIPETRSKAMQIRMGFEVTGRLFYGLAVALTPLSAATVILQATPLVVVAGAAIVFGETVGWRRWAAIFIGLLGVLIIIQPGSAGFSPLSILAVIGMLGLAGRDLASRAAPASLGTTVLGFYGFLMVTVAGAIYALWQGQAFVWPSNHSALLLVGATLAGVSAYSSLMKAMRTGAVSAVTPFRYTRLIFGIALGILVFQEVLTPPMIIGSGLIVLSGLFILWRGKKG